jgi:hypothetical protein
MILPLDAGDRAGVAELGKCTLGVDQGAEVRLISANLSGTNKQQIHLGELLLS